MYPLIDMQTVHLYLGLLLKRKFDYIHKLLHNSKVARVHGKVERTPAKLHSTENVSNTQTHLNCNDVYIMIQHTEW